MRKRIRLTRQLEVNDCGPACLHMIADYYGRECSLEEIKSSCEVTRLGISMRDIKHCASLVGLETFVVKVTIEELKRMPCPSILYLKRGHFVVLERIRDRKKNVEFTIVDPENGRVKLQEDGMKECFLGGAYGLAALFAPMSDYTGKHGLTIPPKKQGLLKQTIKDILLPRKWKYVIIAFLSLITISANWAMPLLLKTTIDEGIMNHDIGIVSLMLISQLLFFIGFTTANTLSVWISTKTGILISMELMSNYFKKIISLPISFFDSGLKTDLIRKLADLSRLQLFTSNTFMTIILTILNILVLSVILMMYDMRVFTLFLLFSVVAIAYNQYFVRKRKYLDYAGFSVNSERDNLIHEFVTGMNEIKLHNAQNARTSQWYKLEDKANKLKLKTLYIDNYMTNGGGLFSRLRDIVLTGLCAYMVINGEMTLGGMMMISFVLGQLAGPITQIIEFSKTFQDVKLSYTRLEKIYEEPLEKNFDKEEEIENSSISFIDMSFRYLGSYNPLVLDRVNISIPLGKVTAIVGATGSGKTTLLKLLLGFYYPTKGKIIIGKKEITEVNLDKWRDKWGVVMQDGRIFSGTVAENIAFADEMPDYEKLCYACKVACIYDRINTLPMRFDTRIGETGLDLSGGEKQRLLVARAVYRNPEYLLFDEATSSLDAATERQIMENLFEFYEGRTVVVIAHRLSTVKNADNIIFLKNGEVTEQGTHEELLARKGAYYTLVGNQLETD